MTVTGVLSAEAAVRVDTAQVDAAHIGTVDSGTVLLLMLAAGVVAAATGGPAVLRRAAPTLMHLPRVTAVLITAGLALWSVSLFAVLQLAVGAFAGSAFSPWSSGGSCGRCMASSRPWHGIWAGEPLSLSLFLFLPSLAAAVLAADLVRVWWRRSRATRRAAAAVRAGSRWMSVQGYDVLVIPDRHPVAFALPGREGGIVMSESALASLSGPELAAVLAHEDAHLRQHHHLLGGLAGLFAHRLRWVPMVAAAADALPHYLEIAADDAAKRRAGTPALAAALLKLGSPVDPVAVVGAPALHVGGPERIRHLVQPRDPGAGVWPTAVLAGGVLALLVAGVVAVVPAAGAVAAHCL